MRFLFKAFLLLPLSSMIAQTQTTVVTWTQTPSLQIYQDQSIEAEWSVKTSRSEDYGTFLIVCPLEAGPHCGAEQGRQQGPKFKGNGTESFKQTFRFDNKAEAGKFYVVAVAAFGSNDATPSAPIEVNYIAKKDPNQVQEQTPQGPTGAPPFIIIPYYQPYPYYPAYPHYYHGYPEEWREHYPYEERPYDHRYYDDHDYHNNDAVRNNEERNRNDVGPNDRSRDRNDSGRNRDRDHGTRGGGRSGGHSHR